MVLRWFGYEIETIFVALFISLGATLGILIYGGMDWTKYLFLLIYIPIALSHLPKKLRPKGQEKLR